MSHIQTFRGFDELAAQLGKQKAQSTANLTITEELRRMRREPSDFDVFHQHQFDDGCPSDHLISAARALGNDVFNDRVIPRWKNESPPQSNQWAARIDECLQMLPVVGYKIDESALIQFDVGNLDLPELPDGYALKGGAARKVLARCLALNVDGDRVRDLDLVHLGNPCDDELDLHLMKVYMQDDWLLTKKNVMEHQPSLRGYLKTREFTINQLVILGDRLYATIPCIADFIGGVIRPTHNHRSLYRGHVRDSVVFKAARFFARGIAIGYAMQLVKITMGPGRPAPYFLFALNLARALECGELAAEVYLSTCQERRLISGIDLSGDPGTDIPVVARFANVDLDFFPEPAVASKKLSPCGVGLAAAG